MGVQWHPRILLFVLRQHALYSRTHFVIVLLLSLVVMGLPALSGAQPTCPPDGDVDQNGSVTAADALLAFQQALGLAQLSACQRTIADVFPQPTNPDGNITASDALCIFQRALSLPSCLDALSPSNQPPMADAGADQSVDAGVMVFLSGTASDPDGSTIASFAWTQTGGTAVSLTGSDAATAVFVAPEVGVDETLTFRLTVTDDGGAQTSDEVRVTVHAVTGTVDPNSAAEVFRQAISAQIVQTKCVTCHVANGASGHTRLVFVRAADTPDHEALNLQTFQDFLAAVANEGGGSYVLNKIQGVGHGGGVQVPAGSTEFADMQQFLGLLGEEVAPPAPLTVATLFDTVIMASPRKTLRRAALIFAGRIPTDAEYAAVENGDETVLRATLRELMEGSQFHEFLIRGSNDRLLTDADVGNDINYPSFVDFSREAYRLKAAAHASGDQRDREKVWAWNNGVGVGVTRAPLELIAYVAENELPYTEILTADYIMANPWAAKAYGASTRFDDPANPYEFKPSRIVGYYRQGEGFEFEYDPVLGAVRIIDAGPLITDYPHAGILNTTVFLWRYPTTATNRNRARARWTYYHFLGLDVEKSASRTTDPVALADTNNPTMHNPNCTVCHSALDPVAGAFQNYNEVGLYKSNWGGLDSLDELYKHPTDPYNIFGDNLFEIQADSWADRQTFSITAWLSQDSRLILAHLNNDWCDDSECGDYGRDFRLDEIVVRDAADGTLVHRVAWEVLDEHCSHGGQYNNGTGEDDHYQWWGRDCEIPLNLTDDATYVIEVVAWADRDGDELAKLAIGATLYQEGDTWYRDMRAPGFNGALAPHPDNSLQWLARQIIADERFAEATVKFWWPAIMGSEIAEFPEVETDADFDGRLLAANAQRTEVKRLADGFRNGFHGGLAYNLKDLLVDMVLSEWFRADGLIDTDPVRRVALHNAGAKRLLTPEELARKTAATTGFQPGRTIGTAPHFGLDYGLHNDLTDRYRLLYGGIDSVGITERARDITSVMAGVAERHAAAVSCPVIMREIYLLPDAQRRLFAGIDPHVTPVSEFSGTSEVTAASRSEMQTFSLQGLLTAGEKTVWLAFLNDYEDERGDRNVLLDRLTVRQGNAVVYSYEMESLNHPFYCHHIEQNAFHLSGSGPGCVLAVPVNIPSDGTYQIEISAWATHAGDELPRLSVLVESDSESSVGATAIRNKLVELHDKLLGVQVSPDAPDVEAAYRLFVDVWNRKRKSEDTEPFSPWSRGCDWQADIFFYEGILEDAVVEYEDEHGRHFVFNRDRVDDFLDGTDFSDPHYIAQTWVVVLAAMMMDDRYLYLH